MEQSLPFGLGTRLGMYDGNSRDNRLLQARLHDVRTLISFMTERNDISSKQKQAFIHDKILSPYQFRGI